MISFLFKNKIVLQIKEINRDFQIIRKEGNYLEAVSSSVPVSVQF